MERNERLLITVEMPLELEGLGYFDIFGARVSRNWFKRLIGKPDYIPMLITNLKSERR